MATFEIKMPKLGESITEGTIISWSVKVGDTVEEDDVLFEVSTAKVSAEIPSPVEGKVKQLLFNEGDTVAVGTVVAILEIEGEGEDNGVQPETSEATQPKEQVPAPVPEELSKNSQEEDRWYSPVVLQLAKAAGVSQDELDHIPGTGYLGLFSYISFIYPLNSQLHSLSVWLHCHDTCLLKHLCRKHTSRNILSRYIRYLRESLQADIPMPR